ncbi:transposase [Enterococcus sp. LJL99]
MSIIQQPTLFDIDFLAQLDCPNRYAELFSPIDFYPILTLFQKENPVGPPIEINYKACVCALVARFIEGIPSIKALVKRLKEDLQFKLSLGFLYSDRVPSQATFSRIT